MVDPFLGPAWARIVRDKREDVGATPAGNVVAEFGAAKLGIDATSDNSRR